MSLIITRGFGESEESVVEYIPIPVCGPQMTSHEVRELCEEECPDLPE